MFYLSFNRAAYDYFVRCHYSGNVTSPLALGVTFLYNQHTYVCRGLLKRFHTIKLHNNNIHKNNVSYLVDITFKLFKYLWKHFSAVLRYKYGIAIKAYQILEQEQTYKNSLEKALFKNILRARKSYLPSVMVTNSLLKYILNISVLSMHHKKCAKPIRFIDQI